MGRKFKIFRCNVGRKFDASKSIFAFMEMVHSKVDFGVMLVQEADGEFDASESIIAFVEMVQSKVDFDVLLVQEVDEKFDASESISAFVKMVQSKGDFDVLLVQEADDLHVEHRHDEDALEQCVAPHPWTRSYGGSGCTAYAAIVNARIKHMVKRFDFRNRCMSIPLQNHNHSRLQIISVHGLLESEAIETLSEITELMHTHPDAWHEHCIRGKQYNAMWYRALAVRDNA